MEFAPLRYGLGTLTIWHGVIFVAILSLVIIARVSGTAGESTLEASVPGLMLASFMIVWMYFLAAPTVGQIYGDKYPFAMVWPSALVLGCLMAVGFVTFVLVSDGKPLTLELAGFSLSAVVMFSALLTLFVCIAHYVMPRAAGFSLFAFPKMSWGVQL
jgi:hypothetical protein